MRLVLLGILAGGVFLYAVVAVDFWRQERGSQSIERARAFPPGELKHPEATLGLIRDSLERDDFSEPVGELVIHARRQAPSSHEAPAFAAVFHSGRLEEPARTRESFESAISRFPASGRLHLDFARWLLMAPSRIAGAAPAESEAEDRVRAALSLEPNLTREALETLARFDVPPERWVGLVPEAPQPRRALVVALAEVGHREMALENLRELLVADTDGWWKHRAAELALAWGDPQLALDAVRLLKVDEDRTGVESHEPGLLETIAYLRLEQLDAGYDAFRAALADVGPTSSDGLKLLCGVAEEYGRRRQFVLAESLFLEASSYAPSYVRALLGLARVRARIGDTESAVAYYERVLMLEPSNERAKAELVSIMARRR